MKWPLAAATFAALLLAHVSAFAQTPDTFLPTPPLVDVAIREAEQRWADALVAQDAAQLDATLFEQFQLSVSRPDGGVGLLAWLDRAAYLASSAQQTYASLVPRVTKVEFFEKGDIRGAMVHIDMTAGWHSADADGAPTQWKAIDFWVFRNDRWQVISRFTDFR